VEVKFRDLSLVESITCECEAAQNLHIWLHSFLELLSSHTITCENTKTRTLPSDEDSSTPYSEDVLTNHLNIHRACENMASPDSTSQTSAKRKEHHDQRQTVVAFQSDEQKRQHEERNWRRFSAAISTAREDVASQHTLVHQPTTFGSIETTTAPLGKVQTSLTNTTERKREYLFGSDRCCNCRGMRTSAIRFPCCGRSICQACCLEWPAPHPLGGCSAKRSSVVVLPLGEDHRAGPARPAHQPSATGITLRKDLLSRNTTKSSAINIKDAQPGPLQYVFPPRPIDNMLSDLSKSIAHLFFRPRHSLFNLPQEIRDMIFDLAYPPTENFIPIIKSEWDVREKQTRRDQWRSPYALRAYPQSKVCEWLVSKAFFLAEARAFIVNQTFDATNSTALNLLFRGTSSIVPQYVTSIKLRLQTIRYTLGRFPNLKVLTTVVFPIDFEPVETRWAWAVDLPGEELRAVVRACEVAEASGILVFHTKAGNCPHATTGVEKAYWEQNVKQLGILIRSILTDPSKRAERQKTTKGCKVAKGGKTPLYRGSKVFLNNARPEAT